MQVLGYIALLFILVIALIKSADLVVHSLRRFSQETHTKVFVLSAILLALATSFPELFVGITSALEKTPHLSLGNVLGANIANISLVAGLSALIVGAVSVHGEFIRHEVWIALVAGLLPILLIFDGTLSSRDGVFLLVIYLVYALSFSKYRFLKVPHLDRPQGYIHRFLRNFTHPKIDGGKAKDIFKLFLGLAILLVSADIIVKIAVKVAVSANIPLFLVGLFLLSIGTTLPELAFSVRSLKDKEPTMFFGNLLGSVIANSTLILGVAAVIHPIEVINLEDSLKAAIFFVLIFSVFWFLIRKKLSLGRVGAALLVGLYLLFIVVELL